MQESKKDKRISKVGEWEDVSVFLNGKKVPTNKAKVNADGSRKITWADIEALKKEMEDGKV